VVQTRFRSGDNTPDQKALLIKGDLSLSYSLTVAFDATGGGLEIKVPWEYLGFVKPPTTPLRFSVAVFRETSLHNTIEVAGVDALDALTDYGDPAIGASPGTATEFSGADATLDDYVDVFFGSDGEPYAPLVIDRFMPLSGSNGGNAWWVTLRNTTTFGLNLASYKVGDAAVPDVLSEGLFTLGAQTLSSNGRYTFASNALTFEANVGRLPDLEVVNSTIKVPDAVKYTAWVPNAGSMTLGTSDDLVLLDGTHTIIDAVAWGPVSSLPAGVTQAIPGAAVADRAFVRNGDTDDCSVDFAAVPQCTQAGKCGTCLSCGLDVCSPSALGSACTDNNVCNGADQCNGAGQCTPKGPALVCNDGNACTTDSCDPSQGCKTAPLANGTSCSDGNACNGAETCSAGSCKTTAALTCDDANPCTLDTCVPASGCSHTAKAGKSCEDGSPCTTGDTCNANGSCSGSALTCEPPPSKCVDSSTSRAFTAGYCDEGGGCAYTEKDTACAFGCSEATGLCSGDPCAEVSCKAPPGQCYVDVGECSGGTCAYAAKPKGAGCDDGDPCTTSDGCNGGACSGVPVACNTPPAPQCLDGGTSRRFTAAGVCTKGTCDYEPRDELCANGCDDATGLCKGDSCAGVVCNTPPSACHLSQGSCNAGTCGYELKRAGSPCDDGDACTTDDVCNGQGSCDGAPLLACGAGGAGPETGGTGGTATGGAAGAGGSGGTLGEGAAGGMIGAPEGGGVNGPAPEGGAPNDTPDNSTGGTTSGSAPDSTGGRAASDTPDDDARPAGDEDANPGSSGCSTSFDQPARTHSLVGLLALLGFALTRRARR
jgi:MYXO-CTERM domain-containing protein